jgi:3-oxo-5alpha-steroid 4-dehydrogenase
MQDRQEKKVGTQEQQDGMTRASFLKLAAGAAAAVGTTGLIGCAQQDADGNGGNSGDGPSAGSTGAATYLPEGQEWAYECDILFCGVGTASGGAIIEAIDRGDDVLAIEKADWIGGICRRNGGGISGAVTKVQEYLGVKDSPDELYDYLMACGEGITDPDMARVIADESGAQVDWVLLELGGQKVEDWDFCTPEDKGMTLCGRPGLNVSGLPNGFAQFGFEPKQRCHWCKPDPADTATDRGYAEGKFMGNALDEGRGGTGLWAIFDKQLTQRNANIKTNTELVKLVTRMTADGSLEVIGAQAKDKSGDIYIKARKAVVITTGSWAANEYLVGTYTLSEPLDIELPDGTVEQDGAGVLAAMAIGGSTINMATMRPHFDGATSGGLRTNTDGQVLDVFGKPIPRLYASSYAVGGKIYEIYAQCGFHVAWNLIFGRRAAKHANTLELWA